NFIIARKPRKHLAQEPALRHSHGTRANYQRAMDQPEQNHVALREDVDTNKGKMDKLLELMQAMASNPQSTKNNGNASWPPFGLPANYTPPE
ncbi:hypothetical protein A2U01_0064747, partial [Trifolium medium]|nr:hypothetical protein [Trifolium medium]